MADQKLLIIVLFLSVLGVVLLAAILGVTSATLSYLHSEDRAVQSVTQVYPALGLPGFEEYSWEDVIRASRGQHVTFWATSVGNYDTWIDDFLVPQMAKLYGITVERVPMGDEGAVKATDQILAELAAGNTKEGSVGLIWTNGPDFHAQREQGLLYGPWAYKVPSAAYYDFSSESIAMDFGQPTEGYELPYNAAQVTFIYEPSCVGNNPPQSMAELVTWVLANPGRFTYAHPGQDYTGAAFIRHFLYEFGGGHAQFDGGYDPVVYRKAVAAAFHQLNRMSAGIYRLPGDPSNKPHYPPGQSETDNLFATGELCITVSYDPDHVGQLIHTPQPDDVVPFPNTTRCWLPKSGTIGNVNFVAIASNSASILGSVVVADYIASMPAVYKRRSTTPPGIGTIQAYDPSSPAFARAGWDIPFADLSSFPETPSAAALAAAFLPEVDADYATQMSIDWELCVEQGLSVASTSAGGSGALCS